MTAGPGAIRVAGAKARAERAAAAHISIDSPEEKKKQNKTKGAEPTISNSRPEICQIIPSNHP